MIAKKASDAVEQAVAYELQNIVKTYGATYASEHEGYAVLLEEIEEAEEALLNMNTKLNELWEQIKINFVGKTCLSQLEVSSKELAKEAVQCAAVCERFIASIKE